MGQRRPCRRHPETRQRCPLSTEADVNSLNPDAHGSLQQNAAAIYRRKVKPYRALVNTTPS